MSENNTGREQEMKVLLQQYARRQAHVNQQTLQALQRAIVSLCEAQQVIATDIQFHRNLSESGDFEQLRQTDIPAQQPQDDGHLPPWLLGRQPDLQ